MCDIAMTLYMLLYGIINGLATFFYTSSPINTKNVILTPESCHNSVNACQCTTLTCIIATYYIPRIGGNKTVATLYNLLVKMVYLHILRHSFAF